VSGALLKADLAALEGAHRKLEGCIGTQRLRAAEKAFAAKLSPSATATGAPAAAATPSPAPVDEGAPSASAAEQASINEILALAKAAGVGRFSAVQEGVATAAATDDCSDTLALARASGIGRYNP
jgi:hypothetical protein